MRKRIVLRAFSLLAIRKAFSFFEEADCFDRIKGNGSILVVPKLRATVYFAMGGGRSAGRATK